MTKLTLYRPCEPDYRDTWRYTRRVCPSTVNEPFEGFAHVGAKRFVPIERSAKDVVEVGFEG